MTAELAEFGNSLGRPNPNQRRLRDRKICRELARGEKTQGQIAKQFGLSQQDVSYIGLRDQELVEQMRADIENDFAGIWLAEKSARLEAYADDYEGSLESQNPHSAMKTSARAGILKNVAEELGQLPPRATTVVMPVVHVVHGVSMEDLK